MVHLLTRLILPNKSNLSYFQRTRYDNDKRVFPLNESSCLEHQAPSFFRLSTIEREIMVYLNKKDGSSDLLEDDNGVDCLHPGVVANYDIGKRD